MLEKGQDPEAFGNFGYGGFPQFNQADTTKMFEQMVSLLISRLLNVMFSMLNLISFWI
jgi:hypothetical protein